MSPAGALLILGGIGVVAYLSTLGKVVDAAKRLRYQLTRIQIYRLKLDQPIIFRVWIEFTNLANIDIIIQHVYIDFYLNFGTEANPNLQRIATLHPDQSIIIPANRSEEIAFDVQVRWVNLAATAAQMFKDKITGGAVNFPTTAIADGEIKTEGFTIPINYTIPFNSTPIEQ